MQALKFRVVRQPDGQHERAVELSCLGKSNTELQKLVVRSLIQQRDKEFAPLVSVVQVAYDRNRYVSQSDTHMHLRTVLFRTVEAATCISNESQVTGLSLEIARAVGPRV